MTLTSTDERTTLELDQRQQFRSHPAYKPLFSLLTTWADGASDLSEEMIDRKAPKLAGAVDQLDDMDSAELEEFVARVAYDVKLSVITKAPIGTSVRSDYNPWLEDRWSASSEKWPRWQAYRRHLQNDGRPVNVLSTLETDVKSILDLTGDPNVEGHWERRGLVIGDVQSGKTSNYIGLLNMAADAGYRLFVVIGGHTEDLRAQTQLRVDDGFLGRSTADPDLKRRASIKHVIGVGHYSSADIPMPMSLTGVSQDFSAGSASTLKGDISNSLAAPLVLVVKKNAKILKNLAAWLEDVSDQQEQLTLPMLVIDDESDYASVDTSKDSEEATAVNRAITELLQRSSRNSYVGFTATPFANVLMDPYNAAGLFPKDFVYSLYAPENYMGALEFFDVEEPEANGVRTRIEDAAGCFPFRHKSDHVVPKLPGSLQDAIDTFMLANALRDLDGAETKPRSMLVNVSRFKKVQKQVWALVKSYVDETRRILENTPLEPEDGFGPNATYERLHKRWKDEYQHLSHDWPTVRGALANAVRTIEVELVNGDTDADRKDRDRRHQAQGTAGRRRRIAVGGTILSRGITLDGLMTSYFHQRTQLSDTLLQMGRWFGYRDGYRHLLRIWLPEEVMEWFVFTGMALQDVRNEVVTMRNAGLTPSEFGLKVRRHPEALKVTAANKMRNSETETLDVSFYRQTVETVSATDVSSEISSNWSAYGELVGGCMQSGTPLDVTPHRIFKGVDRRVVERFLDIFQPGSGDANFTHGGAGEPDSWISKFAKSAEIEGDAGWDVAFMSGMEVDNEQKYRITDSRQIGDPDPQLLSPTVRNAMSWAAHPSPHFRFGNRRVATAGNLKQVADLAGNLDKDRLRTWVSQTEDEDGQSLEAQKMPESFVMASMNRPVLMIYRVVTNQSVWDLRHKKLHGEKEQMHRSIDRPVSLEQRLLGVKVAFPAHRDPSGRMVEGKPVKYVVNKVWLKHAGLSAEDRLETSEPADDE